LPRRARRGRDDLGLVVHDLDQSCLGRAVRAAVQEASRHGYFFVLAFGALRALREAGRRVPEDVALVGFDDLPTAAYADRPLTSVRQPAAEAGRLAARRLIELVAAPGQPRRVIELGTELVVRASSGAPGSRS